MSGNRFPIHLDPDVLISTFPSPSHRIFALCSVFRTMKINFCSPEVRIGRAAVSPISVNEYHLFSKNYLFILLFYLQKLSHSPLLLFFYRSTSSGDIQQNEALCSLKSLSLEKPRKSPDSWKTPPTWTSEQNFFRRLSETISLKHISCYIHTTSKAYNSSSSVHNFYK